MTWMRSRPLLGIALLAAAFSAPPALAQHAPDLARAPLGDGLVVWESNRSGEYRIWARDLAGGAPRQLSRDEPGRDHCCAQIAPDGERVAYLSIRGGERKYTPPEAIGELRWVAVDGRRERPIAAAARHYGEHRAALWWSPAALVFIDAAGDTQLSDLARGIVRRIADGPERGEGFLVDPTGRWATSSTATFSELDPATGAVRLATAFGGCQAWLASDGEVGVWSAGAGGPIDAIELATRRTWTILAKHDPRLPSDRGYHYFPMLSSDRTLLAFGASDDQHDHFRSDYDLFLIELDPATLLPAGGAVRVTADPAVDRFPDVWRAPTNAFRRAAVEPRPVAAPTPSTAGWPSSRFALIFLWEGADRPNRIAADASSEKLMEEGESWFDRRGRLALAGGSFAATPESTARVAAALRASNTVTISLVLEPAAVDGVTEAAILALGSGPRQRGILVTHSGRELGLRIRTGETGPSGGRPATLATLADAGRHHVAFTYSPGRLRTYLDGRPVATPAWAGDFFPWKARELTLGAEPGTAGSFRGWISHLAIFARELGAKEIATDAARALAALAAPLEVARLEVEARLISRARVPTLDEISPYRRALVEESWQIERVIAGADPGPVVRVARWALLDGAASRSVALAPGARERLTLEPFDAQPQLESVVLTEASPAAPGPLWHDVALGGGRD